MGKLLSSVRPAVEGASWAVLGQTKQQQLQQQAPCMRICTFGWSRSMWWSWVIFSQALHTGCSFSSISTPAASWTMCTCGCFNATLSQMLPRPHGLLLLPQTALQATLVLLFECIWGVRVLDVVVGAAAAGCCRGLICRGAQHPDHIHTPLCAF